MKQTFIVLLCVISAVFSVRFNLTHIPYQNKFRSVARGGPAPGSVETDSLNFYKAGYDDGEFYVQITMGTPATHYYAQIDTDSPDLVIHSDSCVNCNQLTTSPVYYKFKGGFSHLFSSTFEYMDCLGTTCNGGCSYIATSPGGKHQVDAKSSQKYVCNFAEAINAQTGLSGIVGLDTFRFHDTTGYPVKVPFGLTRLFQGDNSNQPFSAIFGLGYSSRSFRATNAFDTIVAEYQSKDSSFKNAFSICLPDSINFGDDYASNPLIKWTPSKLQSETKGPGVYKVTITNIKLKFDKVSTTDDGGVSIHRNNTNLNPQSLNMLLSTVVDTGMSNIALTSNSYIAIREMITEKGLLYPGITGLSSKTLFDGYCFPMTSADVARFPDINIYFGSIDNPITVPSNVWLIQGKVPGEYCSAIVPAPKNHGNILGNTFLKLSHVVFDRDLYRIGFGPLSTCPS